MSCSDSGAPGGISMVMIALRISFSTRRALVTPTSPVSTFTESLPRSLLFVLDAVPYQSHYLPYQKRVIGR